MICFLAIASTVSAAQLHLSNGDRITGVVIQRVEGKIYFNSTLFGQIIVDEADAAVVDTPETPVESLAGLPPAKKTKPAKTLLVQATDSSLSDKDSSPFPQKLTKWKGKMEFGFLNQSGRREVLNASLRMEAEHKSGANNLRAVGRYLYGENDNKVASDRQDASFRWRHDVSGRIFAQSLTSYTRDKITQIDLNLEQNGSMGYQLVQGEQHNATVGAGLTLQYREAEGFDSGVNYLGEVFQDYSYKINGRLTLTQAINALYSPNGRVRSITSATNLSNLTNEADNYKVRFNSALQGKMSEHISLNLRYEYEYDNAILDKNGRTDQRITSSVGYAF